MKKLYFLLFTILISAASFGQVIISEIADPNNNDSARYVELLVVGPNAVDFTTLDLIRWTNGNTAISGNRVDLAPLGTVQPGNFVLIAANGTAFQTAYGIAADIDAGTGGPADSNGDDQIAIANKSDDSIVDIFGVPGEDGSGTCHEFENGRAERLTSVTAPNSTFDESEWNVFADSSVMGCTSHQNAPKNAPDDFDPGAQGTPTCDLGLTNETGTCDTITSGTDTYTASLDFTGGGTATYTITSDTGTVDLSMGNPSTDATGTIQITGIQEGTDVNVNVTDGAACDLDRMITSPECVPALTLPLLEEFDYPNGSLTANPNWSDFSGTAGDLSVVSGRAQIFQDNSVSEDAALAFTSAPGNIYFAFDLEVNDPGAAISGNDYEYFAFLKDDGFGFKGRVDIVEATSGGDFSVGIATGDSTADSVWATDLSFGTVYRVIVRYDQDNDVSELWVDATAETDTSISGDTGSSPLSVTQFGLRQSNSSSDENVFVDNLRIATTFNQAALSTTSFEATEFNMFPNPTNTGEITISSINTAEMNVSVYDMLGKEVKNETISNNKLNVSSLKAGIYLVKITQSGASSTKKLVIK